MSGQRAGTARASAVIWRWRGAEPAPEDGSSPARLRLRGALQALGGATFGVASHLFWSRTVAYLAFAAAAVVLFAALVSPTGLYALLRRLFDATGHAVGRVMAWVVLVPIFFLFFLPFGRLLRRGRRDRLRRYFEPEAETYWEPHMVIRSSSRERQY